MVDAETFIEFFLDYCRAHAAAFEKAARRAGTIPARRAVLVEQDGAGADGRRRLAEFVVSGAGHVDGGSVINGLSATHHLFCSFRVDPGHVA